MGFDYNDSEDIEIIFELLEDEGIACTKIISVDEDYGYMFIEIMSYQDFIYVALEESKFITKRREKRIKKIV